METYFKINFAEPGENLPGAKSRRRKSHRFLRKKMTIATSFLVVFVIFTILGTGSYFYTIYLPMNKELKQQREDLKQVEAAFEMKAGIRQENVEKVKSALKTIDEINKTQMKTFYWSNRLTALNNALVKNLWLYSLDIKAQLPPEAPVKSGLNKAEIARQKKQEMKKVKIPTGYKVTIRGATYAGSKKKPLKRISAFMANLTAEPYWGGFFELKDWTVNTKDALVHFEVILESKTLL